MPTYVVKEGIKIITNRIKGSGTEPVYIGWGSGSTATTPDDTAVETELNLGLTALGANPHAGGAGTSTRETTVFAFDTYQVVGTLTASGAGTIANAGLFDAASNGNLFMKGNFTGIGLSSGDSIQFTFKAQLT